MKQWRIDNDGGKPEVQGEKSVPVPFCPTHPMCTGTETVVRGEWPATNRISNATAFIERRTVQLAICNTRAFTLTER